MLRVEAGVDVIHYVGLVEVEMEKDKRITGNTCAPQELRALKRKSSAMGGLDVTDINMLIINQPYLLNLSGEKSFCLSSEKLLMC